MVRVSPLMGDISRAGTPLDRSTPRESSPLTHVPRRTLLALAALAPTIPVLSALSGCSSDPEEEERDHTGPLDEVTFVTTFGTNGRDAAAFVADARGYFAAEGLSVSIEPGQAGDHNHSLLSAGQAQFATVDLSGAFYRFGRDDDPQDDFRVLGAVHQTAQLTLVGFADEISESPGSLHGKTIALAPGSVSEQLWPAYAQESGIEAEQVTVEFAGGPDLIPGLAAGRFDAIAQFLPGAAVVAAAVPDREVVRLDWGRFLPDLYGAGLVTSVDIVTDTPDLAARFTRAFMRGLETSVADPHGAAEDLAAAYPETVVEVAARELEIMAGTVRTDPGLPVGVITGSRVTQACGVLASVGMIGSVGVERVERDCIAWPLVPGADAHPLGEM